MSKSTPGPWTCTPSSHYAHDYRLGIPGGQMPFAQGEGVEYANARVIAAAPDLLAALTRIVEWNNRIMESGMPTEPGITRFQLDEARAAIKKATGAA